MCVPTLGHAQLTSQPVTAGSIAGTVGVAQGGTGTTTAPTSGQVPVGNAGGTAYVPQSLNGDVASVSATGAVTLGANAGNITSGTLTTAVAAAANPISTTTGNISSTTGQIKTTAGGVIQTSGGAIPTATCSGGSTGVSIAAGSTNNRGQIVTSSSASTNCTITWSAASTWSNAPFCSFDDGAASITPTAVSVGACGTATCVIDFASATSKTFNWVCM